MHGMQGAGAHLAVLHDLEGPGLLEDLGEAVRCADDDVAARNVPRRLGPHHLLLV